MDFMHDLKNFLVSTNFYMISFRSNGRDEMILGPKDIDSALCVSVKRHTRFAMTIT